MEKKTFFQVFESYQLSAIHPVIAYSRFHQEKSNFSTLAIQLMFKPCSYQTHIGMFFTIRMAHKQRLHAGSFLIVSLQKMLSLVALILHGLLWVGLARMGKVMPIKRCNPEKHYGFRFVVLTPCERLSCAA